MKIKDFDTVSIATEAELDSFVKERENKDVWHPVFTNEIEAVPLENNEIAISIPNAFKYVTQDGFTVDGFANDVEEEDISSSMKTTKTSVVIPIGNKMQLYPLRYTAFKHIQDRAGITGLSISGLRERARQDEIAPADRALCLNIGFKLHKDKSLVLIRDGKVTGLLSGDENDYQIMPMSNLLSMLRAEMKSAFSQYEFVESNISHEISAVVYRLNDNELEKRIKKILSNNGKTVSNVNIKILLTSSDVGLCSARVTPIITADGVTLPIGEPFCVKHYGKACMAEFANSCHNVLTLYKDNIANIEKLMAIKVLEPLKTFKKIAATIDLSGYAKEIREIGERVEQEHTLSCSAYDIYWYLCEVLFLSKGNCKSSGKNISLYQSLKDQETVAKVLNFDSKMFTE